MITQFEQLPLDYEGWCNGPTWCAAIWLENNDALDQQCRDMAAILSSISDWKAAHRLAAFIEAVIEEKLDEVIGEVQGTLAYALLNWSVETIDVFEIAQAYIGRAKETSIDEMLAGAKATFAAIYPRIPQSEEE